MSDPPSADLVAESPAHKPAEPVAADGPSAMRILFATDGYEHAMAACRLLAALPLPAGSELRVVTVLDAQTWQVPVSLRGAEQKWAEEITRNAEAALAKPGITISRATPRGAPAAEIITAARDFAADLIVVGSEGLRGLSGFMLGSVARNVAQHAGRPALVARALRHGLRKVALAVDESDHAVQAADFTARLPLPSATEIVVVNVTRPYDPFPGLVPSDPAGFRQEVRVVRERLRRSAEALVGRVCARLEAAGKRVCPEIREGDPAAEILKVAAEQQADLIVAGARGVSLIEGLVVGSVADRLLKSGATSVLLVHPESGEAG